MLELLSTLFAVTTVFCTIIVSALCLVLIVNDVAYQPEFAKTKIGWFTAWGGRIGMALIIMASLSFSLDILTESVNNIIILRDMIMGIGLTLALVRRVHRASKENHDYANSLFAYMASKSTAPRASFGKHFIGYITLPMLTFLTFMYGPSLETQFYPILKDYTITEEYRTSTLACWTASYYKNREAKPDYAAYFMNRTGQVFNTTIVREDGSALSVINRPVGHTYTAKLCAIIPPELEHETGLTVTGHVRYTAHPFWHYDHFVGPIMVPDEIPD